MSAGSRISVAVWDFFMIGGSPPFRAPSYRPTRSTPAPPIPFRVIFGCRIRCRVVTSPFNSFVSFH